MAYLIGTDEAGYGPNLGPLVVTVTVWHVDGPRTDIDLYAKLRRIIRAAAEETGSHVVVADSKQLYKAGQGLVALERGVLSLLGVLGLPTGCRSQLWQALDVDCASTPPLDDHWHIGRAMELPVACQGNALAKLTTRLLKAFAAAKTRLVNVRSAVVYPERFNKLTGDCGNKAEVLSRITLGLVAQVLAGCDEPVLAVCDKHGGRNFYSRLLQMQFPEWLVTPRREGLEESVYRWGPEERQVEICFRAGGEAFLPTALASMVSKYLRELAMQAFNEFWQQHLPELKATAGYPGDARRFWSEIRETQTALGIADQVLWRER